MTQPNPLVQIRALKIICFALVFGATLFTIFAFTISTESAAGSEAFDPTIVRIILLVMTISIVLGSKMIAEKILSATTGDFLQRYTSSVIVRLALFEGITLFSGVVLLIIPGSVKHSDPLTFLHLIPLFLLILQAWAVYPTAEKIEMMKQRYQSSNE